MTELSFLIELLLNHKLPKVTKDAVAARIKEIESHQPIQPIAKVPTAPIQQPQAVGHTQQAVSALADRQAAISAAMSGKTEGSSPRKFRGPLPP